MRLMCGKVSSEDKLGKGGKLGGKSWLLCSLNVCKVTHT